MVCSYSEGGFIESEAARLMNCFHAAGHEVHQEIVAEGLRGGEVGLAAAHGGDFLHELHEGEVAGEHKGVDHDIGALAAADFFESFGDDERVEAECIFVDATVGQGECAGLAVESSTVTCGDDLFLRAVAPTTLKAKCTDFVLH